MAFETAREKLYWGSVKFIYLFFPELHKGFHIAILVVYLAPQELVHFPLNMGCENVMSAVKSVLPSSVQLDLLVSCQVPKLCRVRNIINLWSLSKI